MTAFPGLMPVIFPFESTETTSLLLVAQITVLFVQSDGVTVAVKVRVTPLSRLKSSAFILMPSGGTKTVTVQDAVLPFAVAATTWVVPAPTAVTFPD